MFSRFGNLSFLGGMQPHPMFGMQSQVMPVHYPGAFNPQQGGMQPSWGANPQPIGGPMQFPMQQPMMPAQGTMQPQQPQMPVQGTMQRYPLMSGMGRINLGALGGGQMNSQMQRSPQAY